MDDTEQRIIRLEREVRYLASILREIRDQGARSEERTTRNDRNVAAIASAIR